MQDEIAALKAELIETKKALAEVTNKLEAVLGRERTLGPLDPSVAESINEFFSQ